MVKSIETLVEDIYSLFNNVEEIQIDQKHIDAFADGVTRSVVSAISEVRKEREPNLRLSLVGHQDRKIWYEMKGLRKNLFLLLLLSSFFMDILLKNFSFSLLK